MKTLTIKLTLFCFFCFTSLFSQNNTKFSIVDKTSKVPIAFANIIFNNNPKLGTISDIDGVFKIDKQDVTAITISYIGYKTTVINLSELSSTIITLESKISKLEEVIISNTENPAHRIIRNVIKNRELNNPLNINSFSYKSYNKVILDGVNGFNKDSIKPILEGKHLFITETLSKRNYLSPSFSEDEIIATKTSGFKHPSFAVLPTNFQPFSFYDNTILLYDINYLNPISKGSLKKYNFTLEEEITRTKDTVFVISYKPKKNKNFEGLKGVLYVNSNKYAIQNVEAKPYNNNKVTVKIQQKYTFVNDTYWFPEQLNFEMVIGAEDGIFTMKYTGKSYITDIETDIPLQPKDFSFEAITFAKDATDKTDVYWTTNRTDTLNTKELDTYKYIDSIGNKYKFDTKLKIIESLTTGKYPFKYVDLDLTKLGQYNQYEGTRLGLGLYTNDDIIKNVSIGGFLGYGFKDEALKYGGEIKAKIPSKKDISFSLKYENNLKEAGTGFIDRRWHPLSFRGALAERMDQIEGFTFQTNLKLFRNFYWALQLNTMAVTPKYDYQFNTGNGVISNYSNSEFNVNLKYYFKEELIRAFNNTVRIDKGHPVLSFTYSRGLKSIFNGDFNYNAYAMSLEHTFKLKNIGITSYRLEGNYIDTALPYGLLHTGEGSRGTQLFFIAENTFQTLRPYEFLSNASVNLFTKHNFGGLLLKSGRFQPDLVMHNNIGYGSLTDAYRHENISFNTKNKVFLETGLELNNLYRLNYFNVGSIGFGFGVFYRYGDYSLPKTGDNFEFKLSVGISSK
jgi:hypothetical protein